ncbi:OmpA family protein [Actinomyces slackii]|nr:OmpA family protein [Actinomyces slackii]
MNKALPMRRFLTLACASACALSLTACSLNLGSGSSGSDAAAPASEASSQADGETGAQSQASNSSGASAGATTGASAQTVAGYEAGEIPPIPMFTLPDLGLLTDSGGAFTQDLTRDITSVPGVSVGPARCDEPGVLSTGSGTTVIGGDGSASSASSQGPAVVNNGDGSASYSKDNVSIVNNGDGSGSYSDGTVSIVVNGDKSGSYTDTHLSVVVNGDGSGSYTNSQTGESIVINSDGSGSYSTGEVSIVNNGDGSGSYTDKSLSIVNNGDGTALVNAQTVKAKPLPKVGKVGDFPSIDAVNPVTSCGTVITLEDGVLFDFGASEVRADASTTLGNLATVLKDAKAPSIQVLGHTDSIADDAFNQTLSEERAQAVADALKADGVNASMEVIGHGETRPVAPNENPDGSDNPAGRQLNRRVEIFIPAF